MDLYLYLKEHRFVDAWVKGGKVPFYIASSYKKEERSGIFTPDENLIESSTFDISSHRESLWFEGDANNIKFINCTFGGKPLTGTINRHYEDGLVVCLSTRRSKFIARKLEKKACVKINDINELKELIDEKSGVKGLHGLCEYTAGHRRNHFLKSTYDSWQEEYRIFWLGVGNIEIDLPPGMAKHVFNLP
ncbi:hypothetical protein [Vibrio sp.]|uniref:hypothetical protein n=1 Tax=Vibrio sp. TaxID=678 RepID=UPI003AA86D92